MSLFGGSSSASSSSTNNSSTWNSGTIENWANSMDTNINYQNENWLDMNPYMQEFLNYELGPEAFNNAQNVIGAGGSIFKSGLSRLEQAGSITPQEAYAALYGGVKNVYSGMSGFMDNQDAAIQNQVMAQMGGNLANNAQKQMGGQSVAGSSAMNNSAMGIQEAGAESMEEQESQLAMQVLKGSIKSVNNLAGNYARAESGITKDLLGIGGNIIKGGAKMQNNAMSNFWNAAVVEQAYAQKGADVNRKNNMINNNIGIMEDMYWLQTMLQTAGIDTSSTTTGSSSVSKGGLL